MVVTKPTKHYFFTHSLVYSRQYHVIFCPKFRKHVLVGEVAQRLRELILEAQQRYHYQVLDMEVMADHVHLLLSVNPQIGIHSVVGRIKGYSAHMLRKEFPVLKNKLPSLWTRSKFISTVGTVTLDVVKRYIKQQKGR